MRIKQDLPTYNAPVYLRTEGSERKKRRGPNKKKIREIKKAWSFYNFSTMPRIIGKKKVRMAFHPLCLKMLDK
jgi:hypothetical protein